MIFPISISNVTKENSKDLFAAIYSLYPKAHWTNEITKCGEYVANEFNPFENQQNYNFYTKPDTRPYLFDNGEYIFKIQKDFSITTDFENYRGMANIETRTDFTANLFI